MFGTLDKLFDFVNRADAVDHRTTGTATPTASQAASLRNPNDRWTAIRVVPRRDDTTDASLVWLVRVLREYQTAWFDLANRSPVVAFELVRPCPDDLVVQFVTRHQRVAQRLRSILGGRLPVQFGDGVTGLPVAAADSVGGTTYVPREPDWHPLHTDVRRPVTNGVAAALHRHAVPRNRVVVQTRSQAVLKIEKQSQYSPSLA